MADLNPIDTLESGLGLDPNPLGEAEKVFNQTPAGQLISAAKDAVGGNKNKSTNSNKDKTPAETAVQKQIDELAKKKNPTPQDAIKAEFLAFGNGKYDFQPAVGPDFVDTAAVVRQQLKASRPDTEPASLEAWEVRIGGCKMYVPPISISVQQNFHTGSFANSALRQHSPPKFNSGHSETMISMNLYFPNSDQVWGFSGDSITIDFNKDDDSEIDYFLGSLRGLITQFKYAPFLPVKSAYLNGTFGITAVAMHSMTVSTMQGFPFCLQVQLNMLKFNHEVYMPMIDDFNNAIHWGRFRQYIGVAAKTMERIASQSFLTVANNENFDSPQNPLDAQSIRQDLVPQDLTPTLTYNKRTEFLDGKDFDLYYPDHDPSKVVGPDLSLFRSNRDPDSQELPQAQKSWWQGLLGQLGFNIATTGVPSYEQAQRDGRAIGNDRDSAGVDQLLHQEFLLLKPWLDRVNLTANTMGPGQLDEYIQHRLADLPPNTSEGVKTEMTLRIEGAWFAAMYNSFISDPLLQNALEFQERQRGWISIKEWEVPMRKLGLNPNNVLVNGVSCTMANNLAPLQLAMQEAPTYQHIGGMPNTINIALTVFGEDDLVLLRRMYETINGLARLEHGHAVLGFLGIKNVITALCGCKYVLPVDFEVDTVPNFPHVYNVRLTFTDFDVFQQKREILSSEQQAELIEAFSKRNPFLRIFQRWGAFNAYPDMPLDIRDNTGKIVGHYDPDYYFKSFKTIDDDIVDFRGQSPNPQQPQAQDPNALLKHEVQIHLGKISDNGYPQKISVSPTGMSFFDGDNAVLSNVTHSEPALANTVGKPFTDTLTPPAGYAQPYADGSADPTGTFAKMMEDTQFRDKAGRMVRAFPTYMLWLIDEGGTFAGIKMFDNFYGLQSVLDFSLVRSEDIMADVLQIRVSNLYARLSTAYRDLLSEDLFATAKIINTQINRARNLASGLSDFLVQLDTVDLKPGVRVHLRAGYSANPNALDTMFNGTITQVETGDIITITAQSDAVELGAIVNNKDPGASSGKIDGSLMSGLWMSEPRDLMVRLLSMGGSVWREQLAHATRGIIFSENKFGVRHFGTILYEPMSDGELNRQQARVKNVGDIFDGIGSLSPSGVIGGVVGLVNGGIFDLVGSMWKNFQAKRDYELYKRNIYPGNGLGIAQYMGGDLGDGALATGLIPTGVQQTAMGVNPDGTVTDPNTGQTMQVNGGDPRQIIQAAKNAANKASGTTKPAYETLSISSTMGDAIGGLWNDASPFLKAFGITSPDGDDDLKGFDEVSFRAQTYMKSIWDLFLTCAGLLPNYIVAVRPFMDRSTVFYGKPHWMYTSGVIPISTGINEDKAPQIVGPDDQLENILKQVHDAQAQSETTNQFYQRLVTASSQVVGNPADPNSSVAGVQWKGGDVMSLPLRHSSGISIPTRKGRVLRGLHLPTDQNLDADVEKHRQLSALLPRQFQHPYYMDRDDKKSNKTTESVLEDIHGSITQLLEFFGPAAAGDNKDFPSFSLFGESADAPGALPDSGSVVDPALEEFYVAMDWGVQDKPTLYNGKARILAYNTRSRKGCIVGIADRLPKAVQGQVIAFLSPDAYAVLECSTDFEDIVFGFVDDSYAFGPITSDPTGFFTTASGLTSAGAITQTNNDSATQNSNSGKKNLANIPDWMKNHPDKLKQTADPTNYSLFFGWYDQSVPVNFTDPQTGLVDPVGNSAEEVFRQANSKKGDLFADTGRSPGDATDIWNELRTYIWKDKFMVGSFWDQAKSQGVVVDPHDFASDVGGASIDSFIQASKSDVQRVQAGTQAQANAKQVEQSLVKAYKQTLDSFMQFLWSNPYNRGWVVKTADRQFDLVSGDAKDVARMTSDIPFIGDVTGSVADFADNVSSVVSDVTGTATSLVDDAGGFFSDVTTGDVFGAVGDVVDAAGNVIGGAVDAGKDVLHAFGIGGGGKKKRQWNFDRIHGLFQIYIAQGPDAATAWMLSHASPGMDEQGVVGRGIEEIKRNVFDPIYGFVKDFIKSITSVIAGVVSLIRVGIMSLTYGLGMAGQMQKQANLLNKDFNDSIYYAEDPQNPNSLLHLADNPFTREYGEPVVEIREPFQRMHQIDSFSHILNNGLQQNLEGVATIVTATSNGNSPVTVYFDKGAPTDRQIEMTVETGLWLDKPKGFLGNLLHPVTMLRNIFKTEQGAPDSLSAKRIALWHLKESLKDIYGGEILVIGDPHIRPHDLVYLGDVYEQMYGLFEVEQVVHHFTPELGFVTAITPNALVTINDPGRWNMMVMMKGVWQSHILRKQMRASYGVKDGKALYGIPSTTTFGDVAQQNQSAVVGSLQYTHGLSALIKDMTASAAIGSFVIPGIGGPLGAGLGWGAGKWVIDHLLDQHGCYIQYLTRYGAPMDAGLSYNLGVAVGTQRVVTLFQNALGLGRLPIPVTGGTLNQPGDGIIATNDLLGALGWQPQQIDETVQDVDLWTNEINAQILKLSNRQPDGLPMVPINAQIVTVTRIIDGQSFEVAEQNIAPNGVRLGSITAPPITSFVPTTLEEDLGSQSRDYAQKRLIDDPKAQGYKPTVALRISPTGERDKFGRVVAWAFHTVPVGTDPANRDQVLKDFADKFPQVEWDSYLDDGRPYTYNWDAVVHGFANIDRSLFETGIPSEGAQGAGNQ